MIYDVKHIGLDVPFEHAFHYIADPQTLPEWTNAFASVTDNGHASLMTPSGTVDIRLKVLSDQRQGNIDWMMTFSDESVAIAKSRLVALDTNSCAYTFVLTPPPVELEKLEGALAAQSEILAEELIKLKQKLED